MIYVLRHGESTVNIERKLSCKNPEGDLTELGRKQARLAGNWLAHKNITRIYTSPFHRTQQTASIIGELVNIKPANNPDLAEMDCGELEGRTDTQAWKTWEGVFTRWVQADWDAKFPGGESFQNAFDRLKRALQQAEYGENTLLVTHGGITLSVIPYLCVNAAALQRVSALTNTGMIVLDPYDPGRYICESWGLIEHLE